MIRTVIASIVVLAGLSDCHIDLVPAAFDVTIWPDGSGTLNYYSMVPKSIARTAVKDGFLGKVREPEEVAIACVVGGAQFDSLDGVTLGGIRFASSVKKEGSTVKVTIPLSVEAAWYKKLGPSADDLKVIDEVNKSSFGPTSTEPTTIKLKVALPGKVVTQSIAVDGAKAAWKMEVGDEGKNGATLCIPLDAIRGGTMKEAVWEMEGGETLAKVREEWKRRRK